MKTTIQSIALLIVMFITTATYTQDSVPAMRQQVKELEDQRSKLHEQWLERRTYLRSIGISYSSVLKDTIMKRLDKQKESISNIIKPIKKRIYDIELDEILKSERTKKIYEQMQNAKDMYEVEKIMEDYLKLLKQEFLDDPANENNFSGDEVTKIGRTLFQFIQYKLDNDVKKTGNFQNKPSVRMR